MLYLTTMIIKYIENKKYLLLVLILVPLLIMIDFNNIESNYLISLLFNIGFYSITTILLLIYNVKNKNNTIYFIPIIILWIMILFSPVFAEFRYLYPLFLMTPIYLCNSVKKIKKDI